MASVRDIVAVLVSGNKFWATKMGTAVKNTMPKNKLNFTLHEMTTVTCERPQLHLFKD